MKFHGRKLVLLLGILATLQGCKTVYGTAYTYLSVLNPLTNETVDLKLQLAKPPADTPTLSNGYYPGIIFVHGGSWEINTRLSDGFDQAINTAAQNGYVAVSVDYRLATRDANGQVAFPWPAQIQDVKCAIRWLRSHATDFNLDPDRIGIVGISSGGQLALMASETPNNSAFEAPECENAATSEVQAAVSYSGVADMVSSWNGSGFLRAKILKLVDADDSTAVTFDQLQPSTQTLAKGASPLEYIGSSDVPVLISHPQNDIIVPPENSLIYYQSLIDNGRIGYLLKLDRGGHFTNQEGTDARAYSDIQMYKWFDMYLKDIPADMPCGNASTCDIVVP